MNALEKKNIIYLQNKLKKQFKEMGIKDKMTASEKKNLMIKALTKDKIKMQRDGLTYFQKKMKENDPQSFEDYMRRIKEKIDVGKQVDLVPKGKMNKITSDSIFHPTEIVFQIKFFFVDEKGDIYNEELTICTL